MSQSRDRSKAEHLVHASIVHEFASALIHAAINAGGAERDMLDLRFPTNCFRVDAMVLVALGLAEIRTLSPKEVVKRALNPNIRLQKIGEIEDQEVLRLLATTDKSQRVRRAAFARISDQDKLHGAIMRNWLNGYFEHEKHIVRLADQGHLIDVAQRVHSLRGQMVAIQRLFSLGLQEGLADVVIAKDSDENVTFTTVKEGACSRVLDPEQLIRVFHEAQSTEYRVQAFRHSNLSAEQRVQMLIDFSDRTDPDWVISLLTEIEDDEELWRGHLRRITLKAKVPAIACQALCHLSIAEGSELADIEVTEQMLTDWRAEQSQA